LYYKFSTEKVQLGINLFATGSTALLLAAQEKCKDAVKMLLEAGAQADILNYEEMTAADVTLDNDIDINIRKQESEKEPSSK
jgi:ankyrin repeat protein